jgi:hypothetical protein
MSTKDWHVGQEVTIHFPYANQGSPKSVGATVSEVLRKYVAVTTGSGRSTLFDASQRIPRNGHEELYTKNGYFEMQYAHQVHMALQDFWRLEKLPMDLLLQLGDLLAIERPPHLQAKETKPNVEQAPIPHSTHADSASNASHTSKRR